MSRHKSELITLILNLSSYYDVVINMNPFYLLRFRFTVRLTFCTLDNRILCISQMLLFQKSGF